MKKIVFLLILLLIPMVSAMESGTGSINTSWVTVNFDESFNSVPVVFAQVTSENEVDPVIVRMKQVNPNGFKFKLQELPGYDNVHSSEDISWIALEDGEYGEVGRKSIIQQNRFQWRTKVFVNNHTNPYLLAQIQTARNMQPVHVDIKNLIDSRFRLRLEEFFSLDGIHPREVVGYFAFEEVDNAEYDSISVDTNWQYISFNEEFLNEPSVVAQVTSENENSGVFVNIRNVTTEGFYVYLMEDPGFDGVHGYEDVTYLAVGERPLNIAIIDTGSSGISYMEDILTDEGHSYDILQFNDVASDLDDSYDVVIYPGGDYYDVIEVYNNPAMADAIRDFVDDGGGFVGVCGGSIAGSTDLVYDGVTYPGIMLGLLDVEATWDSDWSYYIGNMISLEFESVMEHEIFEGVNVGDTFDLDYAGGPTFDTNEDVLLEYNEDLNGLLDDNNISGRDAVVVGEYGDGNVILSAAHPEYNYDELFLSYAYWVSGYY
jgi:hypothetical protein